MREINQLEYYWLHLCEFRTFRASKVFIFPQENSISFNNFS